jgi:hypothetical protein
MWGRHSILVMLVLALAGCSSGHARSAAAPSTTLPPIASLASTTSTTVAKPRPLYSFDNSVPPPELLNTGTDYPRIAESLLAYSDWVLAHQPTDSALHEAVAVGSSIEKGIESDIRQLRERDRRLYEQTNAPDNLRLINATAHAAALRVVQHLVSRTLIDRDGHIVDRLSAGETTFNVLLSQDSNDRWYLAAVDRVS